jgi:hypothetical protein
VRDVTDVTSSLQAGMTTVDRCFLQIIFHYIITVNGGWTKLHNEELRNLYSAIGLLG